MQLRDMIIITILIGNPLQNQSVAMATVVLHLLRVSYQKLFKYKGTCAEGHACYKDRIHRGRLYTCAQCSKQFDLRYPITWTLNDTI